MKRKLLAILVAFAALAVLLSGCKGKIASPDSPPATPATFSAAIEVNSGDYKVTAMFSQNADGSSTIDVLTPPSLEPLKITYSGQDVSVTYDDLVFETDLKRFPETSFGSILVEVLRIAADSSKLQSTYSNGEWTRTGECAAGKFVIKQSHETSFLQSISVDNVGISIIFSDFEIT